MAILATSAVLTLVRFSLAVPLTSSTYSTQFVAAPSISFVQTRESPFVVAPKSDNSIQPPSPTAANQPFYLLPSPTAAGPSVLTQTGGGPADRTLLTTQLSSAIAVTSPSSEDTTLAETTLAPSPPLPLSTSSWTQSGDSQRTKTTWSLPPRVTDLSSFNILSFTSGRGNLQILADLPPSAYRSSFTSITPISTSSIIQLKYPAHSISPSRFPQGGAQFYASPITLATARNVSLQYSVLFPPDFDWVLGGKLPGLYGGHTGCSGGNEAKDCFSTRLMWRKGGAGELYLYAPKTLQSHTLCSFPGSVCNFDYGLSIGRGSFTWALGTWTTVVQTVVLNTPGVADGWFVLDVNGRRVIEHRDVLYRTELKTETIAPQPTRTAHMMGTGTVTQAKPTTTTEGGGLLGGILGPFLGGAKGLLLGSDSLTVDGLIGERMSKGADMDLVQPQRLFSTTAGTSASNQIEELLGITLGSSPLSGGDEDKAGLSSLDVGLEKPSIAESSRSRQPVGFIGIFFSTFFGGHGERYETPKDQYVWFKDFALKINT